MCFLCKRVTRPLGFVLRSRIITLLERMFFNSTTSIENRFVGCCNNNERPLQKGDNSAPEHKFQCMCHTFAQSTHTPGLTVTSFLCTRIAGSPRVRAINCRMNKLWCRIGCMNPTNIMLGEQKQVAAVCVKHFKLE